MEHDYGRTYWDIKKNFFPEVISGLTVIIRKKAIVPVQEPAKPEEQLAYNEQKDAGMQEVAKDTTAVQQDTVAVSPVVEPEEELKVRVPLFAIKTNLLLDALVAPNVELEIPFKGNKYSLMAEYWQPWFIWGHNSKAYQLFFVGLEGRRWLGDRTKKDLLHGHFLGVYAGGGYYDLEWESKGYQGEIYLNAGVTYGYSFRLSNALRLETSISIGYMQTEYRRYFGMEDDKYLVWQNDGKQTWVGPTKAKVSLSWLLFRNKKGGNQ